MEQAEINKLIADEISRYIIEQELGYDTTIYFNNLSYVLDDNSISVVENKKASEIFEYANDKTVSMTFEGPLYRALNGYFKSYVYNDIDKIVNKYGYYFEMGNSWNMALYKI